jgi:hypothetical protein
MQIKFLNKNFQPKRFDYSPRYYDERKERLELKKAEFQRLKDTELNPDERQALLRQNMKESWSRAQHSQQQRYNANIRTLILIAILLALGYFIFNGMDDVDVVVKKLM